MVFKETRVDLWHVVGLGVGEDARALGNAAGFWIRRGIVKTVQTRGGDRGGTGGARLQRDPEIAVGEALRLKGGTGGADRKDLCVGGRIIQLPCPVACARDNLVVKGDHRPHGDLSPGSGFTSLFQGGLHMGGELWFIRHGRSGCRFPRRCQTCSEGPWLMVNGLQSG